MMNDKTFERIRKVYISCGRLEGTLLSVVSLINMGLITDLKQVVEVIESRLRKEKKEGILSGE
ncbi:hypothetical protein CMI37_14210 [Candidatus Pacearchaeota archaeon]|nr:hypothetical protein [Candidatus Pacearchaeota archaeon]